ncbi:MAG TPA: hypothetical protein VJ870_13255 [Amycolatopsis sp.]|nr:hypothetical protein [Amycolatopsis sp.]
MLFIREGGVAPREAVGALLRRALGGDVDQHRLRGRPGQPPGRAGPTQRGLVPVEPARDCVHALGAAGELSSQAAVRRLITVTTTGLRPRP